MKDPNVIKKATTYSDIFSEDEKIAKTEFREYCKLYHPDANDSDEAAELFSIIQELYNNKHRKIVGSSVKETVIFKDKSTKKGFELQNPVVFNNGIAMVYHTATKIALVYDKTYKKFYLNYLERVKNLQYKDSNMEKEFKRYFPKVLKSFETEDNKYVILLDKTSEVLNLGLIVKSYANKKENFPEKQAAWILNRLYNIVCYMDFYNIVSNGISLDNIWVSPEMHSVLLFNGWEYTTPKGEPMLGCPKDVYKILPIKIKDSKKSNLLTDLESIKTIGRILYKNHDDLEHINKFLNMGISSDNPFEEWDKYGEAIRKQFGKREFIPWENVPYSN